MSNDIFDVNNFTKAANCRKASTPAEVCSSCSQDEPREVKPEENMEKSMHFLGSMGYAQVNMNNPLAKRVKSSVDNFLEDPQYASEHTEICDELVKKGYPLEDAINVTDRIFDTLKAEDTYK